MVIMTSNRRSLFALTALALLATTTLCAAQEPPADEQEPPASEQEPPADEQVPEERFWAFGDSLSDNGNLSLLFATDGIDNTFLPPEAYLPFFPLGEDFVPLQRISTGPTIAEYTAECYGSVLLPSGLAALLPNGPLAANNFAIYLARATDNIPGIDFPYQVAAFAQRVVETGVDVSQDRAFIFIGANDVFQAFDAAVVPIAAGGKEADFEAGKAVLDYTLTSIRTYLIGEGGVLTLPNGSQVLVPSLAMLGIFKFIVSSIPNLKYTPIAKQTAKLLQCDEVLEVADELSQYFGEGLDAIVADMKAAHFDVVVLDTAKEFAKIHDNFKKLGFTNRDDDCFLINILNTFANGIPPTPGVFRDTCSAETTEDFLFIDTVHPTGTVNALLADALLNDLPCANDESSTAKISSNKKSTKKSMKMQMKKGSKR
uniref:SGNH hydrolase-type esterase domain-containing protein n=1 Tax=Amphora coffeiformis TaxID=265554 RepID=A0A7S3LFZ7_9STRA